MKDEAQELIDALDEAIERARVEREQLKDLRRRGADL